MITSVEVEESYEKVTKRLGIMEPHYKSVIQELIDSGDKDAAGIISLFVDQTVEQGSLVISILLLIQKERDTLIDEADDATRLIKLLFNKIKEIKEIPMINGKKGGEKRTYDDYYVVVAQVIADYKGDLFEHGVIRRIARISDRIMMKQMVEDEDFSQELPSQKQADNIIKKLRGAKPQ